MPSSISFSIPEPFLVPNTAVNSSGSASAPSYAWVGNTNDGIYLSGGFPVISQGGTDAAAFAGGGGIEVPGAGGFKWATGGNTVSAPDTALFRNAAGVVEANNGTAGQFREIKLRSMISNAVTFANAAPSPVQGQIQAFTDSTVNTFGATIAGTGANKVLGWFNGTNWTVIGI